MTLFRPCIDLHKGQVKQIVGATLADDGSARENFVSEKPAEYYAARYKEDGLTGGHVIKLGPGNEEAALAALKAYPGGLQVGGGVTLENACALLDAGASHVVVTSWLFRQDGTFDRDRLRTLVEAVGKDRLVLDLSCKRHGESWVVAMNRWQTLTDLPVTHETLDELAQSCAEFMIHAADVEGKCEGIDQDLVRHLGAWGKIPICYAGGAKSLEDLKLVEELSGGRVDLTIGSALDIFGGTLVRYEDCVEWNKKQAAKRLKTDENSP
eukprot:TRINITY_DN35343_c0_g1_i1.p1 TRINITY_DN35343_c0_g1~~TRINITY_DN35343_c0_g1_i1.p1  ORF type:complete len:267 (-),score=35.58 TRINITY_DN35343_c0_g1_i1:395-1195(-)